MNPLRHGVAGQSWQQPKTSTGPQGAVGTCRAFRRRRLQLCPPSLLQAASAVQSGPGWGRLQLCPAAFVRSHAEQCRSLQASACACHSIWLSGSPATAASAAGVSSVMQHGAWCSRYCRCRSSMCCCAKTCELLIICVSPTNQGLPASALVVYAHRVRKSLKMPAHRPQLSDVQVGGQLQWLASQRPDPTLLQPTPRWLLHTVLRRCGRTLTGRQIRRPRQSRRRWDSR